MGRKHSTKDLNENANNYFAKETVLDAIDAQNKLSVKSHTAYIEADAFIGNPYSLLGRVMMIRKQDGKCPDGIANSTFTTEIAPLPIPGIEVDPNSKIDQPITRGSLIVNKDLSVKVGFLNYLSAELSTNSTFSIMVFDQITGLIEVHSPAWREGLNEWIENNRYLLEDDNVCYLYAIIGFVQKNVVRKKFMKLDTAAKGGAYGININGEIHTSSEEYFLDIRFGLTPVILKSPTFKIELPKKDLIEKMTLVNEKEKLTTSMINFSLENGDALPYSLPNNDELNVFSAITKVNSII